MKYQEPTDVTLHAGEPWFMFRSTDVLAPHVLMFYACLLNAAARGAAFPAPDGATVAELSERHKRRIELARQASEVEELGTMMIVWQAQHPQLTKLPD